MSDASGSPIRALQSFMDPDAVADAILDRVGRRVVLAMPLGLGKPNHIYNALFARAAKDASLSLHIFTALTLQRPRFKTDLERRFLAPVIERAVGGYPASPTRRRVEAGGYPPTSR